MKNRKNGRNVDTTFLSRELPSNTPKSKYRDSSFWKKIKRFVASNSRVRNKFRLNNEISISYLETGILKEHNHLERNNRI